MNQIVLGHFECDGSLVYIPVGFKPDYVKLVDFYTDTNIKIYEWWGMMEDDQATGKLEGFSIAEGVTANLADSAGLAVYNSGSEGPTVIDWAASSSPTARTATAHGTYVRPTADSTTAEREAIYECVTAGTGAADEPTWPNVKDGQVTDGTNVWQLAQDVATERLGYQGFRVAAALMTDGYEMYYMAIQADKTIDHGDVVGWTGGIMGA